MGDMTWMLTTAGAQGRCWRGKGIIWLHRGGGIGADSFRHHDSFPAVDDGGAFQARET